MNVNDTANSTHEEVVMLKLVRLAVFEGDTFDLKDAGINWDKLMDVAIEQGVLPWVWDGICRLPENQQPPRLDRINWGLSNQEWRDSYYLQRNILNQIITVCKRETIRVLVLKGVGLSELYPVPDSRVCSDIDIYLFGDYEKGNKLLAGGMFVFGDGDKHASFVYQGVNVENHLTLINTNTRQQRRVEHYLESTLINSELVSDGYYVLPPLANLVFLIMHALSHMESQIAVTVKNLMDIAVFLDKNRTRIDVSECHIVVRRLGLSKSFELLLSLAEKVSNLTFQEYHVSRIPKQDVQRALHMVLDKNTSIDVSLSLPLLTQIKLRKAYYSKMRWKYKYLPLSRISIIMRVFRPPISNAMRHMLKLPMH